MAKSLKLTPEAAQQCADACQELVDTLQDQLNVAQQLGRLAGFGTIESAQQLQRGFEQKARGRPDSAYERIKQFIEIADRMRTNFLAGGRGFTEMDQEFAQSLDNVGSEMQS